MKIGFVLDDRLDIPDGVQQYVKTLGGWLASKGHAVHYLVGEGIAGDPNVHRLSKTIGLRFNKNTVRIPLPASKQRIKKMLHELDLDVLHIQMPYAPWSAGRVMSLAAPNTVIVGTFHVVVDSVAVDRASRLLRTMYRSSKRKLDACWPVSKPAADYMATMMNVRGQIIPNVIDAKQFRLSETIKRDKKDKTTIVFVGRLVKRKNATTLIRAFSLLENRQNYELIICGKGPLHTQLVADANSLDIADQVTFAGFVTEEQKREHLANADIAVFPSSGGESFGIVLLEAMAAGTLVLAGDNIGYRAVLGDVEEVLFPPEDATMLAQKISEYSGSPKKSRSVLKQQQHIVERCDVNNVGSQIVKQYQELSRQKKKKVA